MRDETLSSRSESVACALNTGSWSTRLESLRTVCAVLTVATAPATSVSCCTPRRRASSLSHWSHSSSIRRRIAATRSAGTAFATARKPFSSKKRFCSAVSLIRFPPFGSRSQTSVLVLLPSPNETILRVYHLAHPFEPTFGQDPCRGIELRERMGTDDPDPPIGERVPHQGLRGFGRKPLASVSGHNAVSDFDPAVSARRALETPHADHHAAGCMHQGEPMSPWIRCRRR